MHLRALGLPEEDQQVAPQKVNTILARAASEARLVWQTWCRSGSSISPVGRRGEPRSTVWPIEVFVSGQVLTMAADRHKA